MQLFKQLPFIVLLLVVLGCDMPYEPGPMPEHIVDTEYIESLNIMGIVRSDSVAGSSFVHVQRTMTTEEIYSFEVDPTVQNAIVTVVDEGTNEEWTFQHSSDTLYSGYYFDSTFTPLYGHTYQLTITADSLPTLTATATVPLKPRLDSYIVDSPAKQASFDLLLRDDVYQYSVFLMFANDTLETILEGARNTVETVEFNWRADMGDPLSIMIVGFDENLTRYGNASITFIPNTYHKDESTVNNGYGCFGAVAVASIRLD
jgi:hypothetical protein